MDTDVCLVVRYAHRDGGDEVHGTQHDTWRDAIGALLVWLCEHADAIVLGIWIVTRQEFEQRISDGRTTQE